VIFLWDFADPLTNPNKLPHESTSDVSPFCSQQTGGHCILYLAASTARKRPVRVQCGGHVLVTLLGKTRRRATTRQPLHLPRLWFSKAGTKNGGHRSSGSVAPCIVPGSDSSEIIFTYITYLDTLFHQEHAGVVSSSIVHRSRCHSLTHLLFLSSLSFNRLYSQITVIHFHRYPRHHVSNASRTLGSPSQTRFLSYVVLLGQHNDPPSPIHVHREFLPHHPLHVLLLHRRDLPILLPHQGHRRNRPSQLLLW